MSSGWDRLIGLMAGSMFGLLVIHAAASADSTTCPLLGGKEPRSLDLFDGRPEELAYLIPDHVTGTEATWDVGYVYDAGRTVTIRCKYDGRRVVDVAVPHRVGRCGYHVLRGGGLDMVCR